MLVVNDVRGIPRTAEIHRHISVLIPIFYPIICGIKLGIYFWLGFDEFVLLHGGNMKLSYDYFTMLYKKCAVH